MASPSRTPKLDLSISGALVALSVFVLWGTKEIPPPFFDPIGSAAFPKYTAYIIIALSLAIALRASLALRKPNSPRKKSFREEPLLAISVVITSALYVLSMQWELLSFRWATLVFIFLLSALLSKFEKRVMIFSAIIGIVFGFGGQYLFTEVFYMDLPQ
ncbi:MAG: tripartite tricarboxylate transporter TctB family protein [Opitutaceae bacterium]|nr:tripartite tricarboxylate transporter TctB family protein [Opitutaceae bacterium]